MPPHLCITRLLYTVSMDRRSKPETDPLGASCWTACHDEHYLMLDRQIHVENPSSRRVLYSLQ